MNIGKIDLKKSGFIAMISVIPILALYLPFMLHLDHFWGIPLRESGMQQIFANWDGPNYVYNAITWYDPQSVAAQPFGEKPAIYFAAHLPGYSALIRLAAIPFGFFWGAFVVNILSNVVANAMFYLFIKKVSRHALFLTLVFSVFPARFWIVRSVISPEMLMLACLMGTLYFWQKGRYVLSGVCGLIGIWLKFQMLILIPALVVVIVEQYLKTKSLNWKQFFVPGCMAIGFLLLCLFYAATLGRWDAYFVAQNISGLQMSVPLGMFNYANKWIGTGWTEHMVFYLMGAVLLIAKLHDGAYRSHYWFAVFYTVFLSITPHLDIARYAIPLLPLFFTAFHETFSNKIFRVGFIASIPILYLSALNFIMTNQAPITDWSLFR